jgi:hypothetical protein
MDTLCCYTSSGYGAFLEVACGGASTAVTAGIIAEHAKLQFASLDCSTLKASSAAAGPGANINHADAACLQVASALTNLLSSLIDGSPNKRNFTTASDVPWLAISGRVLQYLAGRQPSAAAATTSAHGSQLWATGAADLGSAGVFEDLQMTCLVLCSSLNLVLRLATTSQRLSGAGYDVISLQQVASVEKRLWVVGEVALCRRLTWHLIGSAFFA